DRAIEKREAEQQELDQDLLLAALAEAAVRVELGDLREHPEQIAGGEALGRGRVTLAKVGADLGGRSVQFEDEERAQEVREAAVELGQIVPLGEQVGDVREDRGLPLVGDDVGELQVALVVHQAQDAPYIRA